MSIAARLKYALVAMLLGAMALLLVLSIAQGLGVAIGDGAFAMVFHPIFYLPTLAVAFVFAPALAERLPFSGDRKNDSESQRPPVPYLMRLGLWMLFTFVAAMLVASMVFLFRALT